MDTERVAHYIEPLKSNTFPKRFIYLDTESASVYIDGWQVQTFRIASASCDRWSERHRGWVEKSGFHFTTPDELWDWVESFTIVSHPTVLWCHNLGFDVRISRALIDLPLRGWDFDTVRLGDDIAWMRCKDLRGRTLIFCDTTTWFASSIENLGRLTGIRKEELPDNDNDSLDEWFARCDADVAILAESWRRVRDWIINNNLGPWKMTGPSQGWAVWRRQFYTHRVLVHDDMEVLEMERRASYAGRAEAFRYGPLKGKHTELDYRHSYASTCAQAMVPTRKVSPPLTTERAKSNVFDYLNSRGESSYVLGCASERTYLVDASVEIDIQDDGAYDIPALPYRTVSPDSGNPSRVIWPEGVFRGTWWLPELLAAEQAGQLRRMEVHSVTNYICEPALADWARWAISVIDSHDSDPVIVAVVKQWTRTMVGRFGLRYVDYSRSNNFPGDEEFSAGTWIFGNEPDELPRRTLQIADQLYVCSPAADGSDSSPQVMSYIMMLTRLRLLEAMQRAGGTQHVVYCDTDGFIVDKDGLKNLSNDPEVVAGHLRPKSSYSDLVVFGPKQLILDGKPRVSGLPSRPLSHNDDGSWTVEKWERTRAALESGMVDRVRVRTVDMHLSGNNGRRSIPDKESDSQFTTTLRVHEEA